MTNKRKRSIGITALLSAVIAGLVILSAGLVLGLSSQTAWKNTFELLREQSDLSTALMETEIRNHINPAMEIARYIHAQVAAGELNPKNKDALINTFIGALAAAPQIAGVVLWDENINRVEVRRDENGALLIIDEVETVTQEFRDLLTQVRQNDAPMWGAPNDGDGKGNYIYTLTPLNFGDEYFGVMATGVTIDNLSSIVAQIGEAYDMTAFILYGDNVLAHPKLSDAPIIRRDDGRVLLTEIAALGDPVIAQFHDAEPFTPPDANFQIRSITVDGFEYWALSRANFEWGDTPWQIGIYGPSDTLDAQIDRLVGSGIAGGVVLLFAIGCALWIARKISKPIRVLADNAEKIGRLELSGVNAIAKSNIKELDEQGASFKRMVDGLQWFERYVPKSLVRKLIHERGDGNLVSREAEISVMFTDIIGFTARTESMPPGEVGDMLNAHFEIIAACIEAEGGTLDKYIGDAVMAFWGAPEDQPDHAQRACRAALAIADALHEAAHDGDGTAPLRIKMAIHSGPLLVGNIGATSRMNYTVIGDTVNTCSRIESLCAKLDDGAAAVILVSSDTTRLAGDDAGLRFEEVGGFEVKGRSGEVHVSRLRR